jgi:hypothetical protein
VPISILTLSKRVIKLFLFTICFLIYFTGCAITPPEPKLLVGSKVQLKPATLHVSGEPIEMYGGNALLFKYPLDAAMYLRYLREGNLGKAGSLVVDKALLRVDRPLTATLVEYKEGDGPSRIKLDLDALPTSWNKSNWKEWADCYVFNIHIEPLQAKVLDKNSTTTSKSPAPKSQSERQQDLSLHFQPTVKFEIKRDPKGYLVVTGDTNLPNGTKLGITLYGLEKNKKLAKPDQAKDYGNSSIGQTLSNLDRELKQSVAESGLIGQDFGVYVQNGRFSSAGFSNKGTPYPSGRYEVRILLYRNVFWQTQDVLKQIGGGPEFSWSNTVNMSPFPAGSK